MIKKFCKNFKDSRNIQNISRKATAVTDHRQPIFPSSLSCATGDTRERLQTTLLPLSTLNPYCA